MLIVAMSEQISAAAQSSVSGDPLSLLREQLRLLHLHAGKPSSREIRSRVKTAISHTTATAVLRCAKNPRWRQLELVIQALHGNVDEFRPLWVAAEEAAAKGSVLVAGSDQTGPTGPATPNHQTTEGSRPPAQTRSATEFDRPPIGHIGPVTAAAFSPDGHLLATASHDQTVRLGSANQDPAHLGAELNEHRRQGNELAAQVERRLILECVLGQGWWPAGGVPLTGRTGHVVAVAFSPDGHLLATTGYDKKVRLWNPNTGTPIGGPLTGHTDKVTAVAFSPDGRLLATTGFDQTVRLWNATNGTPMGEPLTGHTAMVRAVAFSPDGHLLATAGLDQTVRLWDPITRMPICGPLTGHTDMVTAVAFSPDGRLLATTGYDKKVQLWNPTTRIPICEPLTGHTAMVTAVAFSPDGRLLATASLDQTVRLWDPTTRIPICEPLTGHTDIVTAVAFSPDGHLVATGSHDGTVRLWDPTTRTPMGGPLTGHTGPVIAVAFSPDGRFLATGGRDWVRLRHRQVVMQQKWGLRDPVGPCPRRRSGVGC
jgi:WD40 repeat protein